MHEGDSDIRATIYWYMGDGGRGVQKSSTRVGGEREGGGICTHDGAVPSSRLQRDVRRAHGGVGQGAHEDGAI